jgi:hypothetical protein
MPKSGYASVTIRDATYELARGKAEKDGLKVSEFTERAIRNYVASLQGMEDRARLIAEILRQLEETRADQATATRQLTLLADRAAERSSPGV